MALNISHKKLRDLVPQVDESTYDAARSYFAAVENGRPTYDAIAKLETFANPITMQDCVYPFKVQTVKAGDIMIRLTIEPRNVSTRALDWLGHVVVDDDCRLSLSPMNSWTMYRTGYAFNGHMRTIPLEPWNLTVAACKYKKSHGLLPARLQIVELPVQEYFYCVNEALSPGDAVVPIVACMTRYFARYRKEEERRKVAVLFPDVPQYEGVANIFHLFRKHLTEVTFKMLPLNALIVLRSGSRLHVPQFVCRLPPQRHIFMWRELVPRVNALLSQKLVPHRRVALISYELPSNRSVSLTNRAFRLGQSFSAMLARFQIIAIPPSAPHDEKMFYMNNAAFYFTSLGSNDALLAEYGGQVNGIPRLSFIHSGYKGEMLQCKLEQVLCKMGVLWIYFPPENDLDKVPESLIAEFIQFAESYGKNCSSRFDDVNWKTLHTYRAWW